MKLKEPSAAKPADYFKDVIAAIATPVGEGGIGIVRLSGDGALAVAEKIFESPKKIAPSAQASHTTQYGFIVDPSSPVHSRADEVMLLVMRGPRSYTCEDTVEINCHGGRAVTQKVLELCIGSGARAADPGEFTKRAFLNGRIDLIQAETVLEVIRAKTEKTLEAAQRQLQGDLSVRVLALRDEIAQMLSHIEASLDFPDDFLEPMQMRQLAEKGRKLVGELDALIGGARHARWIRDGAKVVLTGEPNVGKSSLMNRLAQKDRVIVSPHPGTTRDTVEETVEIAGYPVILSDTAGVRPTDDAIEAQSVERSRRAVEDADLILFVADGARRPTEAEAAYWNSLEKKSRRLVVNKIDAGSTDVIALYGSWPGAAPLIRTSCATGEGIENLSEAIAGFMKQNLPERSEEVWVYSVRQQHLFRKASLHAAEACRSLETGLSPEFAASDLRLAMDALGSIVGLLVTDDILDLVFSQFCVGK